MKTDGLLGKNIDQYKIISSLGAGGSGTVYLVTSNEKKFAMKLLSKDYYDNNSLSFRRETSYIASFTHKNIVKIFDFSTYQNYYYIVYEFIEGESLRSYLDRKKKLSLKETLNISINLCEALEVFHSKGLAHLDIKPENIMFTKNYQIKLVDFGFSQVVFEPAPIEQNSQIAISLSYCSPEQLKIIKIKPDGRSDLFSVGCIICEMLTGRSPFPFYNIDDYIKRLLNNEPMEIGKIVKYTNSFMGNIVKILLAKDPKYRYQSSTGLLHDLKAVLIEKYNTTDFKLKSHDFLTHDSELPFVGRTSDILAINKNIDTAISEGGPPLFVTGFPGIGKSRLIREAIKKQLDDSHKKFYSVKCSSSDLQNPLSSMTPLIESMISSILNSDRKKLDIFVRSIESDLRLLIKVFPIISKLFDTIKITTISTREDSQHTFINSIICFLFEFRVSFGEYVIFIDDIHWLDQLSQTLVNQVIKIAPQLRVGFILAARSNHKQQIEEEFINFIDLSPTEPLAVEFLESTSSSKLIDHFLGHRNIEISFKNKIVKMAGGNPLLLIETIRAIINSGHLRLKNNSWYLENLDLGSLKISENVEELLFVRINFLGEKVIEQLSIASIIGTLFDLNDVKAVSEIDREILTKNMLIAVGKNIVEQVSADKFQFVNEQLKEVLYRRLSEHEKSQINLRLAEIYELKVANSSASELARFRLNGFPEKNKLKTFTACSAAANIALSKFAYSQAIIYFKSCFSYIDELEISKSELYSLWFNYGFVLSRVGLTSKSIDAFKRAEKFTLSSYQYALCQCSVAEIYLTLGMVSKSTDTFISSAKKLGIIFPKSNVLKVIKIAFLSIYIYLRIFLKFDFGKRQKSDTFKLVDRIYDGLGLSSYYTAKVVDLVFCFFTKFNISYSIGEGRELVVSHANLAGMWSLFCLKKLTNFHLQKSEDLSTTIEDRLSLIRVKNFRSFAKGFIGEPFEAEKLALSAID